MDDINEIVFDGAKILEVTRDEGKNSFAIVIQQAIESAPIHIKFNDIKEEKAQLYIQKDISELNSYIPPVEVIEIFDNENNFYRFSGYVKNTPWAVWEFRAENYKITC